MEVVPQRRRAAFLTTAKASGRRASRDSPLARRALNSAVLLLTASFGQALVLQFVGVDLFDQRGALAEESPVMAASEKFEDTEKHGSGCRLGIEKPSQSLKTAESSPETTDRTINPHPPAMGSGTNVGV